MSSILVIGDIYAETQYFVSKIPTEDEFMIADDAVAMFGSKTLNAARILARLDNQVSYYAHAGSDSDGESADAFVKNQKLISLVTLVSEEKTGKIVVTTAQSGKSSVTLFKGANQTIDVGTILDLADEIESADAVYAATNLPLEGLYTLVELCHKQKKILLLDVPNQHELIDLKRFSTVDFFMPNRQETGLLLKRRIQTIDDAIKAAQDLRKNIAGTIIITLDKDGCVVLEKESTKVEHIKAKPVKSVDETAAGDIFRAVFLNYYLKSKSVKQSIEKALSVATESTKIKGVDETLRKVGLSE